ncbi:glycoside hydrolase family 13 protein [Trametes versicolor FP-101664 SS1]|uniref:glycoside hydrolase family 13 protein n=1 Tax=Trametes versicolor (strain FP-101664) TaxID=717944 RepID=UPI0004621714|nr:glycoside hydrolase family 13 protein [Trametes versicolor FP-101664 SS1]EIW57027.1 glycoside hydrolase family 13 protein [Trametes versicolor FP-101664 SS1]
MLRLALLTSLLATSAFAASADEWRNRTIYQVITDRFATSDGSSPSCDTSQRQYCGGTWKGLVGKLDYIQNMGFDAVWISPVVANVEGNTTYGEAFHGYWTQDINSLNSHFGTADDLKSLSTALHNRGMYLMVDVVVNHMVGTADPPNFSAFQPFSSQSDFHSECFVSNYDNQTEVEQCWLGDKNVPLVDINTEDNDVVTTMNNWISTLVSNYSVDGVRIDTVKHVRKDFWPDFAKSAGVFTIGEVLNNETSYVSAYTQVIDAVLDYPSWFPLVAAFQTSNGNLSALAATVQQAQSSYKDGEFMTGAFLENHDQPRFQSLTQDSALIKNAMTWPFVQDAIPILYYGQEQSYAGGADPANREALWLSGYVEDKPLVTHVKTLNAARKAAIAANSSFLTTAVKFPSSGSDSTMAILKPPMLALLSNGGSSSTPKWTVSDAGFQANEELVDVLTCTKMNADSNGGVTVQGSGGSPQVLIPTSALSTAGTTCSSLATVTQTSSARGWVDGAADSLPVLAALVLAVWAAQSSLVL